MQNLGFVFAIIPLIKTCGLNAASAASLMKRHLRMFNTHPYLTGPVIGSVVKLEMEEQAEQAIDNLKTAMMGPYAAIGDAFFWGAWRPFSAVGAVLLATAGIGWAPLVFLFNYNLAPAYVRVQGFIEGYRRGKRGIEFVGGLNLPELAGRLRLITVVVLGLLAMLMYQDARQARIFAVPDILMASLFAGSVLVCFWMLSKGVSVIKILYGAVALIILIGHGTYQGF